MMSWCNRAFRGSKFIEGFHELPPGCRGSTFVPSLQPSMSWFAPAQVLFHIFHFDGDLVDLAAELCFLGTVADSECHWRLIVETDIRSLVR